MTAVPVLASWRWKTGRCASRTPDYHGSDGRATPRRTRVTLKTVLASLAEGCTPDEILADFLTLMPEHVRAAIALRAAVRAS
jgi:uncharacterized protein (DUF433 family)